MPVAGVGPRLKLSIFGLVPRKMQPICRRADIEGRGVQTHRRDRVGATLVGCIKTRSDLVVIPCGARILRLFVLRAPTRLKNRCAFTARSSSHSLLVIARGPTGRSNKSRQRHAAGKPGRLRARPQWSPVQRCRFALEPSLSPSAAASREGRENRGRPAVPSMPSFSGARISVLDHNAQRQAHVGVGIVHPYRCEGQLKAQLPLGIVDRQAP